MKATLDHLKPAPVKIKDLEFGDNFEYGLCIFKVVSGVKQFTHGDDSLAAVTYAVDEITGEVMQFNSTDEVYKLADVDVTFKYEGQQ